MILDQSRSTLLNYAVERFTPDIFSHPVWLRFGKKDPAESWQIAADLSLAAKNLRKENPSAACQLLLLCAVYQNYAVQYSQAIKTTRHAQSIAHHAGLIKETIWSMWGACAIYIHQGNYPRASDSLADLQATLTGQNEWILANFIDILRQDYLHLSQDRRGKDSAFLHVSKSDDLFSITLECLTRWGCTIESGWSDREAIPFFIEEHTVTHTAAIRSFFSIQKWRGHWQNFKLAIQAELRLQWIAKGLQPVGGESATGENMTGQASMHQSGQFCEPQVKVDYTSHQKTFSSPAQEPNIPDRATVSRKLQALEKGKDYKKQPDTTIPIAAYMLGSFSMTIDGKIVKITPPKGLSMLKYLLLHRDRHIPREVLMDIFWPDAGLETARNNLNVAMHSLRKSLRTVVSNPVIKFEEGTYRLASDLQVWLDVEEFEKRVNTGRMFEIQNQLAEAIGEYEAAISLYQGDLLEENPYEEWIVLSRERVRITYIDTLDRLSQIYFVQERYAACISVCQQLLERDHCREDAHCLLMRCYSRQGQSHLALRQYQACLDTLHDELDVAPDLMTTQLAERIRRHEWV